LHPWYLSVNSDLEFIDIWWWSTWTISYRYVLNTYYLLFTDFPSNIWAWASTTLTLTASACELFYGFLIKAFILLILIFITVWIIFLNILTNKNQNILRSGYWLFYAIKQNSMIRWDWKIRELYRYMRWLEHFNN